jgi:predicted Zn finger-like uncharacterized protein
MPAGRPSGSFFFTCPHCDALYQIVKGEAGPESANRNVACRSCSALMPGRDGQFVLKYFRLAMLDAADGRRARGADTVRS